MLSIFYKKELCKPLILIPVSSKSVERCGICERLNICIWNVIKVAICRLSDVTQPNQICVIEIKDKPVDTLHYLKLNIFSGVLGGISSEKQNM